MDVVAPNLPSWGRAWIERGHDVARLREEISTLDPESRAALLRFPPGCIVECPCGWPTCPRYMIVIGVHRHGDELHFAVRLRPDDTEKLCLSVESPIRAVAHRGGLDGDALALLLSAAGDA